MDAAIYPSRNLINSDRNTITKGDHAHLAGNEESMRAGATYGMAVQGVVRNMDIVNCFASFLPRALPDQRKEQAEFGKRVVAMFYLEQMYKAQRSGMDYAALGLKRADALWRFASFLCD